MQIYTGIAFGTSFVKVKKRELGIIITPSKTFKPVKYFREVPCCLDNGAFTAWRLGYPFQEDLFKFTMEKCYDLRIKLNFIVCPDMVAGGIRSLDFSMKWATGPFLTAHRLALVVQDGMGPVDLTEDILSHFTHIFIGGTVGWKWDTAEEWATFAKEKGKKLHIGQAGKKEAREKAERIGADSIDSTSLIRNASHEFWNLPEDAGNAINTDAQ